MDPDSYPKLISNFVSHSWILEFKSDSQLHDAAGSQIPPLHYAAGRQISPLHFDDVAGSQIFPLHFAAGSQILPLYDAVGSQILLPHDAARSLFGSGGSSLKTLEDSLGP